MSLLGVKEELVMRAIPKWLKEEIGILQARVNDLEEWKIVKVSDWAVGVDASIDTLEDGEKKLISDVMSTQKDLAMARSDAVNAAMEKLGLPSDILPGDVGHFLTRIRNISKKVPAAPKIQTFTMIATPTPVTQAVITPATTAPTQITPGAQIRFMGGGPFGLGVAPRVRRGLKDQLGPDLPGIDDFMSRIEDLTVESYDKLKTITVQWDTFFDGVNSWMGDRANLIDATQWTWKVKQDINNLVDNGILPAKAQGKIQGWIGTAVEQVKGIASSYQLSGESLTAVQSLIKDVPGTQVRTYSAIQTVSKWYYERKTEMGNMINDAIAAYQNKTLPDFIRTKIDSYVTTGDFKDAILSKLSATTLYDKLYEKIPNVSVVRDGLTRLTKNFDGVTGVFVNLKNASKNSIDHVKETIRIIGQYDDKLKADLVGWKKDWDRDWDLFKDDTSVGEVPNIPTDVKRLLDDLKNLVTDVVWETVKGIIKELRNGLNAIVGEFKTALDIDLTFPSFADLSNKLTMKSPV